MKRRILLVSVSAMVTVLGGIVVSGPAHATFPGANGRIAFRRYFNDAHTRGAIFTIRRNGTDLVQLTHLGKVGLDTEPDYSPNGRWIAFRRVRPGRPSRIFKMRANGTHITRLSNGPSDQQDLEPAWSPDGKRIAFHSYNDSVGFDALFVMHANGTHVHQIPGTDIYPGGIDFPTWSPDGARLVFEGGNSRGYAVYIIHRDGTHLRRLTPWKLHAGNGPDWSPDGRWILVESHAEQDRQDNLYLVHPNGKDLHKITRSPAHVHQWLGYSFSPDGTMITVAHNLALGLNPDIYVLNLDGSGLRDVTNSAIFDSAPDWGPRPA